VDRAVHRTLMVRFAAGLFDPVDDQPYARIGAEARATPQSKRVALDASRQVVTLLKNAQGMLPWPKGGRIAVVGPLGGNGTGPKQWIYPDIASGVMAVNPTANVTFVKGCLVQGGDKSGFQEAVLAAQDADRVVLVLGSDTTIEREFYDRSSISLPGLQDALATAVLAAGRPTTVVLVSMGALAVDSLKQHAPAILLNHYTGDGVATAEVLFGDVNPSGKLPYTMYPSNFTQTTDFLNMSMVAGEGRGYRYYTGRPLWAFGHGLSYTTFKINVEKDATGVGPWSVCVQNTGDRFGAEVVQAYVRGPLDVDSGNQVPFKRLVAYQKVALKPNESNVITIEIAEAQFATVSMKGERELLPGRYRLEFTNGVDQTATSDIVLGGVFAV